METYVCGYNVWLIDFKALIDNLNCYKGDNLCLCIQSFGENNKNLWILYTYITRISMLGLNIYSVLILLHNSIEITCFPSYLYTYSTAWVALNLFLKKHTIHKQFRF